MPVHIQDKEKILVAFNHLWNELDKTWQPVEGSTNVRSLLALAIIAEQLGMSYDKRTEQFVTSNTGDII